MQKIKHENTFWAWKKFQNTVDVKLFNKTIRLGKKNPKNINIGSILESSVVQV